MLSNTRMMLTRHLVNRLAKRSRKGFTLIELLVVVVIIGILASVALPSFVGAQDKARNASVQANGRTIQLALEQYATDNNGTYPTQTNWNTTIANAANNYLKGNTLPPGPWNSGSVTSQTAPVAVAAPLLNTAASVSKTPPAAISPVNTTEINAAGVVPNGVWAAAQYGNFSYDYDIATQYYVLYGTGKKNKAAILVSSISNAGN